MACYDAPVGSIWRLDKYGYDWILMLMDHVGSWQPARRCVDLRTGRYAEFTFSSTFNEEVERIV